ncbi:tetratricopeptide repeat protein [Candidatus Leptofilum sp.]|uniref:tetratricopeptide repeat protein n=1 Tax=Candidatus Leptofilum sp. TaxID=3241576 RepID=UPI003B5971E2
MVASVAITDQARWRTVLEQQKVANAQRWLTILEYSNEPKKLVQEDYDNFLRALETTLQKPKTFDIAYSLYQLLYPIVFGYADWDRWLVYSRQALHTSQLLHMQDREALLLEKAGDILYHKGDLKASEASYFKASQIYEGSANPTYYYRTLAMLATLKDIQGEVEEGIKLCQKAETLAEASGNKLAIAHANLNLSNIYRRIRNWEKAQESAQKAFDLYQGLDLSTFLTKASITLILTWAETGEWSKVGQLSNDLITVLNSTGDVHNLSQLKNNLGILAFGQGNYKMAEATWQEALQLLSQIQEPTELAGIYNNLGMVYTKMAEWETAEEMLLKAITAYRRFGDLFNWANSLDNLADLYEARGQTAEFEQTLQEAIAGLQVLKDTPHARELLEYMQKRLPTNQ